MAVRRDLGVRGAHQQIVQSGMQEISAEHQVLLIDDKNSPSIVALLTHSASETIAKIDAELKWLNPEDWRNEVRIGYLNKLKEEILSASRQYKPEMSKTEFERFSNTHKNILDTVTMIDDNEFSERLKVAIAAFLAVIMLAVAITLTLVFLKFIIVPSIVFATTVGPAIVNGVVGSIAAGFGIFQSVENYQKAKSVNAALDFAQFMEDHKPVIKVSG